MTSAAPEDLWAAWLRRRRHGSSEALLQATLDELAVVRDRVLDAAAVGPGDVVLDVGCGDGLIGVGALGRGAEVIFSDISAACLEDCYSIVGDRARYVCADACDLGDVEADVVTTRSVLIYVDDKERAFAEFFRVLRPAGRLSIFEPINSFGAAERKATFGGWNSDGIEELLERVLAEIERAEGEAGGLDAMLNFDAYDLFRLAETAGFQQIRLETTAELKSEPTFRLRDWEAFVNASWNPRAPSLREAMEQALDEDQRRQVEAHLRPQVEGGRGTSRFALAYLFASKAGR